MWPRVTLWEGCPMSAQVSPWPVCGVTLDKLICHSKPYFPYLYNGEANSPPSERTQQGKPHGALAYSRSPINYYVGVLTFIWECGGI